MCPDIFFLKQKSHKLFLLLIIAWGLVSPAPGLSRGLTEEPTRLSENAVFPDRNLTSRDSTSFCRGFNFSKVPDRFLHYRPVPDYFSYGTNYADDRYRSINSSVSRKDIVLEEITNDSGSILAMAVGAIAFLYFMPEDFSKWPEEKKDLSPDKLWERYEKNVSSGPVWDHDEWEVNYIGHPYFGAAYYTHAMNKNFSRLEALSYSFMMSTCLYEYGVEAFFEDPSIQDLVVTPVIGALLGEVFITLRDKIHDNGGKVLGSKHLGSACTFFLDPIGVTLKPINDFNEKYSKLHMDANYFSRSVMTNNSYAHSKDLYDHRAGVEITIYTDALFL